MTRKGKIATRFDQFVQPSVEAVDVDTPLYRGRYEKRISLDLARDYDPLHPVLGVEGDDKSYVYTDYDLQLSTDTQNKLTTKEEREENAKRRAEWEKEFDRKLKNRERRKTKAVRVSRDTWHLGRDCLFPDYKCIGPEFFLGLDFHPVP